MAYSTLADVQIAVGGAARLVALADFDKDGVADAGVVDAAIAEADGEINSYAKAHFAIPIVPTPNNFAKRSARMAARYLRRDRGMLTTQDVEDEKADREWLRDLAGGKVHPDVTPTPTQSSLVVDKAAPRDSSKNVSREKTKGYW